MTSILILIMRKGRNLHIKTINLQIKNIKILKIFWFNYTHRHWLIAMSRTLNHASRTRIMNETETILAFAQFCLGEPLRLSMRTNLISTEEGHVLGALILSLSLGMWETFQEEVTSKLRLKGTVHVNQVIRERRQRWQRNEADSAGEGPVSQVRAI